MIEPTVVYEDNNFVAVNKPSGYLTHHVGHGKEKTSPALTDWLLEHYPEIKSVGDPDIVTGLLDETRPGIVHRLDQETSGIIIVPKNQDYFAYLKSLFKERKIKKTYLAWVWGEPKSAQGTIEEPIGIKPGSIRRSVGRGKMLKPAVTEYKVINRAENNKGETFSLLEVMPHTGRTHQIRVHLKHIGLPIVGDKMYGRRKDPFERLMLHSNSLEFEASPGKKIKIEADPPADFGIDIAQKSYTIAR